MRFGFFGFVLLRLILFADCQGMKINDVLLQFRRAKNMLQVLPWKALEGKKVRTCERSAIIVTCKAGRKKYAFPLADLAAIEKKSDNARHIQDYRVWFANR